MSKKKKGTQPKNTIKVYQKMLKIREIQISLKNKTTRKVIKIKTINQLTIKIIKTKPSIHTKKFKQMYGEVLDKLDEKGKGLWIIIFI